MRINLRDSQIASKLVLLLCLILCTLFATSSFAANSPLMADQAFVFSVETHANQMMAKWHIAPGYYLYQQRLQINVTPQPQTTIALPLGETKSDPNRGSFAVYTGDLTIPIVMPKEARHIQLKVIYQGCSEGGFCYPPTQKNVKLDLTQDHVATPVVTSHAQATNLFSLLNDQKSVSAVFFGHNLSVMLLIFAGIGLLLAFTPCVLPMIPILTSIIVGQRENASATKAFTLSLTYVLGSALTYAAAGLGAATMGSSLQVWLQKSWIIASVSGLFIVLAFSLFGLYHLRLPNRLHHLMHRISSKQQSGTYIGVLVMGIISTLVVSPCVTAPLVGVLIYISQTGDKMLGASALFAMGIGMGLPLMIVGVSAGKWMPKRGPWMVAVKEMFGILMLGMAIWMLARILHPSIIAVLWGILIGGSILHVSLKILRARKIYYQWAYALGAAAGIACIAFSAGMIKSLDQFNYQQSVLVSENNFVKVRNVSELNKQLLIAQSAGKPVMLDFYADWCESCIIMDRKVFQAPEVKQVLSQFVLLRADLTANNAEDENFLKQYSVIAPPTVLFFNDQGKEVNSHRIIGEMDAKQFLLRLNTFITASCDKKMAC